MGLDVKFVQGKVPTDAASWARAFRDVPVKPSSKSVTPAELADSTTQFIDDTANTAAQAKADAAQAAAIAASSATASNLANAAKTEAIAVSASALADHVANPDPHPVYATAAEVSSAISAHAGASDPHPVYLTQTEGDARYLQQPVTLTNAVDDAAAAAAGVAIGKFYRNGSVVMIRVS